jgi:tRNA 2-selenouridine synthase
MGLIIGHVSLNISIVKSWLATVAQLAEFDAIIDVRSPAEFADDHLPGAINCPVLDNEERIRVGTIYKQVSPFEARKVGAALVARNIARHVEEQFQQHPKTWRPLIYCWRGGQRSGAFTHILREIGWAAHRLEGGYKSWRNHVIETLQTLPPTLSFRVICGPTGSGKSRLLEALAAEGAQVLHLEQLAAHRGSVLGGLPDEQQPSQRTFESRLMSALSSFDSRRTVFVESESRRIGVLNLPNSLYQAMHAAPSLQLDTRVEARVAFLLHDYAFLLTGEHLKAQLQRLRGLQSNETLARWVQNIENGEFETLVTELLQMHYDPHYQSSLRRHFSAQTAMPAYKLDEVTEHKLREVATQILADASR